MKSPANPYVGPRAFVENELLYGRDREVADLRDMLLAERIVLLYSPSGAGKSSLLQARLIPVMRERGFTVRKVIRVNAAPPPAATGNRYVISMMASMQLEGRPTEFEKLTLNQYLDAEPNGELLVFDQFEEVLTTDPVNLEAKRYFFEQVGHALRARGRWALFAMREDFLAALDPYLNSIPTRLSNTFRLGLLSVEASKAAIREPAARVGVKFLDDAVQQIADDLRQVNVPQLDGSVALQLGPFIEPVQLQVVCLRRWEELAEGSTEITKSAQAQIGSTALADYYAATVAQVASESGTKQRTIRDWFEHSLITKIHTRGQVLMGTEETDGLNNDAVLKRLEEAHLVNSELRLGSRWLELAHDRLIEPVRSSNKEWRDANLNPFQQEAEKWNQNSERSPDRLLRGQALQQAEAWAKNNLLSSTELEFLKASKRARRALLLGRMVTALMGILLVTAAVFAWEFQQEKTRYLNALRSGRKMTSDLVFQIDEELSHLPNTSSVRKELLGKAIQLNEQLNEQLGVRGGDKYHADTIDWWAHKLEAEVADHDGKPDEAEIHYQHAKTIADELVADHGDDPDAQHLLMLSYKALGEFRKKQGDNAKGDKEQNAKWLEATGQYQKALPIALKLVNGDPKNRLSRFELVFLLKDLADAIEDPNEARKQYDQALAESTRLAQEDPKDDMAQTLLWDSLVRLGDWSQNDGKDIQKAIGFYQQALTVAEQLYQSKPPGSDADSHARHLTYERLLWANYMALGDVGQDVSNRRNWYEKARTLATELYQEDQAQKLAEERPKTRSSESQAKKDLDKTLEALRELDQPAPK